VAFLFPWPIAAGGTPAGASVDTAGTAHHKSALAIAGPSPGVLATGECPERQRGRTVNPLAYAFVGSSPTSPTTQSPREIVSGPGAERTRDFKDLPRLWFRCEPARAPEIQRRTRPVSPSRMAFSIFPAEAQPRRFAHSGDEFALIARALQIALMTAPRFRALHLLRRGPD
jgi:hypothetical protein